MGRVILKIILPILVFAGYYQLVQHSIPPEEPDTSSLETIIDQKEYIPIDSNINKLDMPIRTENDTLMQFIQETVEDELNRQLD
jgi:hypothetical protein